LNKLYLVRHGENTANLTKEFSCLKVDYSLTEKGILQARQTAEHLANLGIDEIYSSPLKRAVETARIIAERLWLGVTLMENFREVNVGSLEGEPPTVENWRYYARIITDWDSGAVDSCFPGGENYLTLSARVKQGIKQIVEGKDGKRVVVVAHGGIFAAAARELCHATNGDGDIRSQIRGEIGNCAVCEIDIQVVNGELRGTLHSWADWSHLYGEAAGMVAAMPEL